MNGSTPGSKSAVSSDVEIHGSIAFKGDLAFGGKLTGGGIKGPNLTVTPGAKIVGNIECETFLLHGTVTGNVIVAAKCELKESAELVGDLTSNRLLMGDGATFIGKARINSNGKNPPAK
jgi:cytoskeletal protein CcmA (bactofilin family)